MLYDVGKQCFRTPVSFTKPQVKQVIRSFQQHLLGLYPAVFHLFHNSTVENRFESVCVCVALPAWSPIACFSKIFKINIPFPLYEI